MSGQVKWFSSENFNAPSLGNNWGDLINVLNKCLIDGYGSQNITSVVISDGVGVATFPGAHKLEMFQWIKFTGATNTTLNTEFKILGLTSNTIEFLIDLPDQTITESIACSLAPIGWSKPFSDEGRAVFQAKNTDTNPYFLRVDDTCDPLHTPTRAKFAKVGILESCTSIDDISGPQAPFDPLAPTKNWIGTGTAGSTAAIIGWARWVYATAHTSYANNGPLSAVAVDGVRDWILVGDDTGFYILPIIIPKNLDTVASKYSVCYGFGIFEGKDCPFLTAKYNYAALSSSGYAGDIYSLSSENTGYLILLKNLDGTYINGSNITENDTRLSYGLDKSGMSGTSNRYAVDPINGVYHCNFHARDAKNSYLGVLPFLRCVLNSTATSELQTSIFSENGKAYIKQKHINNAAARGSIIIDLGDII